MNRVGRRLTTSEFKQKVYDLVQDEYQVLGEYEKAHQKILMKHRVCGHEYTSLPKNFLNGHRCPNCNKGRCPKNN